MAGGSRAERKSRDEALSILMEMFPDTDIKQLVVVLDSCNLDVSSAAAALSSNAYRNAQDAVTGTTVWNGYSSISVARLNAESDAFNYETTTTMEAGTSSNGEEHGYSKDAYEAVAFHTRSMDVINERATTKEQFDARSKKMSDLFQEAKRAFKGVSIDSGGSGTSANSSTRKHAGMYKMQMLVEQRKGWDAAEYNKGRDAIRHISTRLANTSGGVSTEDRIPYTIDLHHKTINEAMSFAEGAAEEFIKHRELKTIHRKLKVVTGVGRHTQPGAKRLHKPVVEYLKGLGYKVTDEFGYFIVVD